MSCRKELKIYEAGKMCGLSFDEMNRWRVDLKNILINEARYAGYQVQIINPVEFYNFEEKRYQSEEEVMEFDLYHVRTSDIIVVNLDGLSSSDGTKIEIHDAKYHNKIPVIAFGNKELYNNLHPWVKNCITRVENNILGIAEYIKDFYMI